MRFPCLMFADRRRSVLAACALLVGLPAFGCGARVDQVESAQVEPAPADTLDQEADLGFVFALADPGKMVDVRHVFTISNPFGEPMQLQTVYSSCGCTSAKVRTPKIGPGESGEVEVTVEAPAISDSVRETVELATGIAGEPPIILSLAATIVPRLEVAEFAPGPIPVRRGAKAKFSFRVSGRQPADEPAARLVMQGPLPPELVEAELGDEDERVMNGVRYVRGKVDVQVQWPGERSGAPDAVRQAALEFRFGDARLKQTIRWARAVSIAPTPASVFFGTESAKSRSRVVRLEAPRAFSITRIDSTSDEIWAKCDSTGPATTHSVTIGRRSVESPAANGPKARTQEIVVVTDDLDEPEVVIPVWVLQTR